MCVCVCGVTGAVFSGCVVSRVSREMVSVLWWLCCVVVVVLSAGHPVVEMVSVLCCQVVLCCVVLDVLWWLYRQQGIQRPGITGIAGA